MTNEMVVRRAKSAKIGKTLTAYLILSPDGGEGGLEREGGEAENQIRGRRHYATGITILGCLILYQSVTVPKMLKDTDTDTFLQIFRYRFRYFF